MNILNLNEDCLLHIFSFLDLYDLVTLTQMEDIFKVVIRRIFQRQKEFKIYFREIEVDKTTSILYYIGPHLRNLSMTVGYSMPNYLVSPILQAVVKLCKNLNSLTIHYLKINENHINCLQQIVSELEYLDLSYCDLDDNAEVLLVMCKKLIYLVLKGNLRYHGKGLEGIKTLKKLEVEFATVFENPIFRELKSQNPHLEIEVYEYGRMVKSVIEV